MRPFMSGLGSAALLLILSVTTARADLLVTELAPMAGGSSAGLRVGDLLFEWQSEAGGGRLDDPLSFALLEIEAMPRGVLTFVGERDGQPIHWEIPPTDWGISTGLANSESTLPRQRAWEAFDRARQILGDGEREEAQAQFALAFMADRADPSDATITSVLLQLEWSYALNGIGDRAAARIAGEQGLDILRASGAERPLLEAQILESIGVAARRTSDLDAAELLLNESLALRREYVPDTCPVAKTLYDLHHCAFMRGQLDLATELGEESLAIYESLPGSEYLAARVRSTLGRVSLTLGEHEKARAQFESALAVFLRLDPEGPDVGESYTNLGILARRSGDLALAEERFLLALAIFEAIDATGPAAAMVTNNLGAVVFDRGDLLAAEYYIGRALELREERDPGSMAVAMYLNNVAGIAFERGDLTKAEGLYLRALAIREKLAPESLDTALSNENLGSVCYERGNLERSAQYYERSAEMVHALAPGGADEARILGNMGRLAARQDDLELALQLQEQSLAIRTELSAGSVDCASSLAGLAEVNRRLGHYALAMEQLEEAVAISESLAPGGLNVASYYGMLSTLNLESGDPVQALVFAERSLQLRQELVAGSYWEAVAWHSVGRAQRANQQWELALAAFVKATELMDLQDANVGEVESARIGFQARHADIYRDCVDARVRIGDLEGAVEDLERSRARSFLAMLGQRDLQFTADLPPELLADRRRNRTEYDRTLSELAAVSPSRDPEDAERLAERLADLTEERERIAAEVKSLSPQLDALQRPRQLSAREILGLIPDDTVLISYSVGPERSHAFVLTGASASGDMSNSGDTTVGAKPGIEVFTLEIHRSELEARIRRFRAEIQEKGAYQSDAAALYELLIEPAALQIAERGHMLLSPDGPLHLLPFAALMLPSDNESERFLVQWRPLHFTTSMAVYAELTQRAPAAAEGRIVVFADPLMSAGDVAQGTQSSAGETSQFAMNTSSTRGVAGSARELGRLEFARQEAASIEELYGPTRTTLYFGSDASEAGAKQLSGEYAVAHFACHGLADQENPLNSALILGEAATPDTWDENGFLQSWEVLEALRFDADLVTLSACETALGADMGGEGLVSLVRSFQYAGAACVLASLWQVADQPTADEMEFFYRALRDGQAKDEALRGAQIVAASGEIEAFESSAERGVGGLSDASAVATHPFYWAAFQLYGNPAAIR